MLITFDFRIQIIIIFFILIHLAAIAFAVAPIILKKITTITLSLYDFGNTDPRVPEIQWNPLRGPIERYVSPSKFANAVTGEHLYQLLPQVYYMVLTPNDKTVRYVKFSGVTYYALKWDRVNRQYQSAILAKSTARRFIQELKRKNPSYLKKHQVIVNRLDISPTLFPCKLVEY